MIASKIGKTFLKAYNRKYDTEYSAKEFFIKVYWEIVFNHPLYLMSGGNSPFENPKISWKKGDRPSKKNRKERLSKMINKIESETADASIVIGFPASIEKGYGPTSGNVTDINVGISYDNKYLSWIGGSLGIGVSDGFAILFDNEEILLKTFEGWKKYRELLNDNSIKNLSGNKINSWNGRWLSYKFSEYYNDNPDFSLLTNEDFFAEGKSNDKGYIVIETIKWSRLFFNLSKSLVHENLIGYVFKPFYKGDTTLGFIPFHFNQARSLIKNYKYLFGDYYNVNIKEIENLFGLSIKNACKIGSIGFQSLQPADFSKDIKEILKENKKNNINNIKYKSYKTWLITMINKEDTLEMTDKIAKLLHLFVDGSKGTDRKNLVNSKLLQSNKKKFLSCWYEIVANSQPEERQKLKEISDKIFLMSSEEFSYFLPLLKLDYKYQDINK